VSFRKGKNNSLTAGRTIPGPRGPSAHEHGGTRPWSPPCGTLEDLRALVRTARQAGMEVALDYALQCSPVHPYGPASIPAVVLCPARRPTIRYAENPPKKIPGHLPAQLLLRGTARRSGEAKKHSAVLGLEQGVRIFRVGQPAHQAHTVLGLGHRGDPSGGTLRFSSLPRGLHAGRR